MENFTSFNGYMVEDSESREQIKLLKNYATPEMYGAVGDGVFDCSDIFNNMIANTNISKIVLSPNKTYLVSKPIIINRNNLTIEGNNSAIIKNSTVGYDFVTTINAKSYTGELRSITYDFNTEYGVIIIIPNQQNPNGYIRIKDVQIRGTKINNNGIMTPWGRNIYLDNVRISQCKNGVIFGGFLNTFNDLSVWDCYIDGITTDCCLATSLYSCYCMGVPIRIKYGSVNMCGCSCDDGFPSCYNIYKSIVTMEGCTSENCQIAIQCEDSTLYVSGDFEHHIYDKTTKIGFIVAVNSIINGNGLTIRMNNYLNLDVPTSNLIECSNNSKIKIDCKIIYGDVPIKYYSDVSSRIVVNGNKKAPETRLTYSIDLREYTQSNPYVTQAGGYININNYAEISTNEILTVNFGGSAIIKAQPKNAQCVYVPEGTSIYSNINELSFGTSMSVIFLQYVL